MTNRHLTATSEENLGYLCGEFLRGFSISLGISFGAFPCAYVFLLILE